MTYVDELKHAQRLRDPARRVTGRHSWVKGPTSKHLTRVRKELELPLGDPHSTERDPRRAHYSPSINGPIFLPMRID